MQWIGGTPAQRARWALQEAKEQLTHWPEVEEEFRCRFRAAHAAHRLDPQSRKLRRRVRGLIAEWRTICATRDSLVALVALGND